jgi:hypothetical protein
MTPCNVLRGTAAAATFLLLALVPGGAGAQSCKLADEPARELDFDRPEAWAMEWTAS